MQHPKIMAPDAPPKLVWFLLRYAFLTARSHALAQEMICNDPPLAEGGGACGWECGCYSEADQSAHAEQIEKCYRQLDLVYNQMHEALYDWLGEETYDDLMAQPL